MNIVFEVMFDFGIFILGISCGMRIGAWYFTKKKDEDI
jgi:hypothetical protein